MTEHCSAEMLEAALSGTLSGDQEQALHQHLEQCPVCCGALDQMAGGADFCEQAACLLANDPLDATAPNRDEWSIVDFSVELLDPSDDPNVLGCLGGYQIVEVIGRGGMGVVMKGFDPELKRYVAIKALAPHLGHSSLARKRFAREAQAAAAVVNLHVMAIHQVQPNGRLPFLVMPLLSGESLAQRLAARGTLELKEILRIGMQAAAGLAAAHEQGLIHRDVKPANILLEMGVERAVLTDFGLARTADDVSMTRCGVIAGTPQYMSPEQARGEPLDCRSDLFSLGCVLYEMATGVSPFRADTTLGVLNRVMNERPRALASLNPELPPWFIGIVDKLLEKDPRRRFASAKEVSELLERCLAHVQQPTITTLPDWLQPYSHRGGSRRRLFNRILFGSGIGFIVMLLISGMWSPMFALMLTPEEVKATSESNLHRLTAALLAYEQEHGHYPPSVIYGKDGQGGHAHSWRVEILPYLGHKALYGQYRVDEPWDSPHNKTVMAQMPDVFRAPRAHRRSTNSSYFGVTLEEPRPMLRRAVDSGGSSPMEGSGAGGDALGGRGGATSKPTASQELIDVARQRLDLAKSDVERTRKLQKTGAVSEAEVIRLELDQELARLQLAEAEGNRKIVLEALDKLVEVREQTWARIKELNQRGVVASEELDRAEIEYHEARIRRASSQSKLSDMRKSLEQIATIKARHYERLKEMVTRGVVPQSKLQAAEIDSKMAQALFRASVDAAKVPDPDAAKFHADDLNQIHSLTKHWMADTNKAGCAVCHEATQLDFWKTRSMFMLGEGHRSGGDSGSGRVTIGAEELTARQKAADLWRIAFKAPDDRRKFLRRVMLDVAGRVPTQQEMNAFASPEKTNNFDQFVTELLKGEQLPQGIIADGVFVPAGSTIFSRPAGARPIEILDGTMNTIALVECKRDIPWTKPDDITYEPGSADSVLGGWYDEGWYAGLADGRVKFMSKDTPAATIRAWLTIGGAEQDTDNVLLSFTAEWCKPCQTMNPVVSRLERQGYSIRQVDIDREPDLASKYGVLSIPAFVLVANGREVKRASGVTSEQELISMMNMLEKKEDQKDIGRTR